MGLDMYAYVATRAGQHHDYWDGVEFDEQTKEYVNAKTSQPREIAYWRKHPNLHGWMEQLWTHKLAAEGKVPEEGSEWGSTFNGIELELTFEDLDSLERDIKKRQLPATSGFFFGNPSDEYYYKQDLDFIKQARAEMFLGLKVFYNSSW